MRVFRNRQRQPKARSSGETTFDTLISISTRLRSPKASSSAWAEDVRWCSITLSSIWASQQASLRQDALSGISDAYLELNRALTYLNLGSNFNDKAQHQVDLAVLSLDSVAFQLDLADRLK